MRPIGLLSAGFGLFNGIVSYHQNLVIGGTVDPHIFLDPWSYVDCLQESFNKLHVAAKP